MQRLGSIWWVEVKGGRDDRPLIAFYHSERAAAEERKHQLERELAETTPDGFRRRYRLPTEPTPDGETID